MAGESIYISFKKENVILSGNIFVKIMHLSRGGKHKMVCRYGFHTSFLNVQEKDPRFKKLDDSNDDELHLHCTMD